MHPKQVKTVAAPEWGVQERKTVDRFTRSLALKVAQIVVESRLGQKIKTASKVYSSDSFSDSFNLSIKDIPEVLAEAKKALAGQIPTAGLGMCVEISLKTVEGDTMVLETWYLEMTEQCDASARVTYTVYNRMSLLLKSLIAVTRVTPAYKVATLQGPGSFVICYRVYMGDPQWHTLGESYQSVKVGQVGTPVGTLVLSVAYRTQLTITPQKGPSKDCPFMVKSDHFKPDMSPKHGQRPSHIVAFPIEQRSVVDELAAACEDCQEVHPVASQKQNPNHALTNGDRKPSARNGRDHDNSPTRAWDRQVSFSNCKKVGAFAVDTNKTNSPEAADYFIPDAPFSSLLPLSASETANLNHLNHNCSNNNLVNNNHNAPDEVDSRSVASEEDLQKSHSSEASCVDDFVLVELKPPFAGTDEGAPSELGAFFRECQTAPALVSFSDQPTFADQVDELTSQLANFESTLPEFDDFVESLCQEETAK